jgi:hypothetical protein
MVHRGQLILLPSLRILLHVRLDPPHIRHSDQGMQHAAHVYGNLLQTHQV